MEGEMKVYWVSRHDLSPAQVSAIHSLHGEDAEIIKEPVVFNTTDGLADYIRNHSDGFVYAVAGAPHYLVAALVGLHFGVFENHPQKRQDGSFGLAAVYHVAQMGHNEYSEEQLQWMRTENATGGRVRRPRGVDQFPRWVDEGSKLVKVWVNSDPMSDNGEILAPIER